MTRPRQALLALLITGFACDPPEQGPKALPKAPTPEGNMSPEGEPGPPPGAPGPDDGPPPEGDADGAVAPPQSKVIIGKLGSDPVTLRFTTKGLDAGTRFNLDLLPKASPSDVVFGVVELGAGDVELKVPRDAGEVYLHAFVDGQEGIVTGAVSTAPVDIGTDDLEAPPLKFKADYSPKSIPGYKAQSGPPEGEEPDGPPAGDPSADDAAPGDPEPGEDAPEDAPATDGPPPPE